VEQMRNKTKAWSCVIPLAPRGKGRPRVAVMGKGRARAYTDKLTKQWEKDAAVVLRAYWKRPPLSGPVALWIDAYKARPKRLLRLSDPSGPMLAPVKPDADNVAKLTADSANGILYEDDAQICALYVRTFYTEKGGTPRVEIKLSTLDESSALGSTC
jgi:Holliday junction resolvase RusA-like endonuclease